MEAGDLLEQTNENDLLKQMVMESSLLKQTADSMFVCSSRSNNYDLLEQTTFHSDLLEQTASV